jgi:hypothetical protein
MFSHIFLFQYNVSIRAFSLRTSNTIFFVFCSSRWQLSSHDRMWFLVDYTHGYTKKDPSPLVIAGICLGPALLYLLSN